MGGGGCVEITSYKGGSDEKGSRKGITRLSVTNLTKKKQTEKERGIDLGKKGKVMGFWGGVR